MAVRHRELPVDGRPVPSRVGADAARPRPDPELPGGGVIQQALAELLEGRDLSQADAREVMRSIMAGEATPGQIGGFLVALRLKGETADEIAGCAEAMREHVLVVTPERSDLVDTAGTGGDGAEDVQHLDRCGARRRGCRRGRGEAREPRGLVVVGLGGRARGARLQPRAASGVDRPLDRRARLRLPVRAHAPSGDAPRGADSAGAGDAHGLQRARAADEPSRRAGPGRRRLRAGARADDRGGAGPARRRARVRRPRRGRNRRALACGAESRLRGRGRRGAATRDRPARAGRRRAALPRSSRGGEPAENAETIRRIFAGADGGKRDAVLLNAAGAIAAGGLAKDLAEGVGLAREAVDSGAAGERLDALIAFSRNAEVAA